MGPNGLHMNPYVTILETCWGHSTNGLLLAAKIVVVNIQYRGGICAEKGLRGFKYSTCYVEPWKIVFVWDWNSAL